MMLSLRFNAPRHVAARLAAAGGATALACGAAVAIAAEDCLRQPATPGA